GAGFGHSVIGNLEPRLAGAIYRNHADAPGPRGGFAHGPAGGHPTHASGAGLQPASSERHGRSPGQRRASAGFPEPAGLCAGAQLLVMWLGAPMLALHGLHGAASGQKRTAAAAMSPLWGPFARPSWLPGMRRPGSQTDG